MLLRLKELLDCGSIYLGKLHIVKIRTQVLVCYEVTFVKGSE